MDLSNKSLALMLLATIAISGSFSLLSVLEMNALRSTPLTISGSTGLQTGWAAVNITANTGCEIDRNVNFGTNATEALLLTTNTTNIGSTSTFNDCSTGNDCIGMEVNNTGNLDVWLNFSSSDAGSTFLGGAAVDADFLYVVKNGTAAAPDKEQGGCFNITGLTGWSDYANVPTTTTTLCRNFTSEDSADIINIEYNVTLRTDTPGGVKNATITVTCVQI